MPNLFNQDYLYHLASKYNLRPSRQYGQNYLIDEEVINKILEIANVSKKDTVVEVGPGFGVLTLPLSEKVEKVVAFEIEKKLQTYWDEKLIQYKNIEVVWGNVLKQVESLKFKVESPDKVVANLPYQVTSAVIRLFLEANPPAGGPPETMTLMVQKEVAERICAKPGDMSLLAVSVQYYADPKLEFIVPRTAFWPSPQVDSAVITVKHKRQNTKDKKEIENFFNLVRVGFANRRKLLLKNLEPVVGKKNKEKLKKTFEDLELLPTVRAQELSVEQWLGLSRLLSFDANPR